MSRPTRRSSDRAPDLRAAKRAWCRLLACVLVAGCSGSIDLGDVDASSAADAHARDDAATLEDSAITFDEDAALAGDGGALEADAGEADAGAPDSDAGSPGETRRPPVGYPNLLFAATPIAADGTYDEFLARTGLTRRWGDRTEPAPPRYGVRNVGGRRAIEVMAIEGGRGGSGGLLLPGMPRDGVRGGPRASFGRVKAYWHPDYDYNPYRADSSGNWTVRDGAGGCKFAGFWGGGTPATADDFDNDGWALTIWTGGSGNYIALGLDVDDPRASSGFATSQIYRVDGEEWWIHENQGRWVQLEWEHIIESTAGGAGRVRMWIDGVKGIDREIRYFDPDQWDPQAGLKGVYLRNFYGGTGRAPRDTPMYYADIEVWTR